jgi:hypothetical protein
MSEESFRLIERSFDKPGLRRKAKVALTTMLRISNLKGSATFIAEISDLARDMDYSYPHAASALNLLEVLKLCFIKRMKHPGTELDAPSQYTVFPPLEQNVIPLEQCKKFDEGPTIPKNSPKNSPKHTPKREQALSLNELVTLLEPEFTDRPVKRSLSDMLRIKGKEYMTVSNGRVWLTNERCRNKPKPALVEEPKPDSAGGESRPADPENSPGPEAFQKFQEIRAALAASKNGAEAAAVSEEDTQERYRMILAQAEQLKNTPPR